MLRALSVSAGFCLALVACGGDAVPTPAAIVELSLDDDAGSPNILAIYDQTGLVAGARFLPNFDHIEALTVTQGADETIIDVAWVGLGCESRPTLSITSHASGVQVTLDHGPRPDSCAAMAENYGVQVELSEPVPLSEIEAAETGQLDS